MCTDKDKPCVFCKYDDKLVELDAIKEIIKRTEDQRKLNLEMMKKINKIANNQQTLVKPIAEQTHSFKVVVEGITKLSEENLKKSLRIVAEQVVDLMTDVGCE